MAVTPYQMPNLAAYNRPIADPNSQQKLRAYQDYVTGLLTDPMARAEFGTGLLQGTTTDLAGAPADIYSGAVGLAQAVTPQNAPQNRFFMTNPFYMLSQSGDLAEQASSVAGSEALGEAVYGKPQEGYAKYRDPARIVGGLTGGGELLLGKASAKVAPYIGDAVNYLTDAMPRPQVATPDGLLMDAPQQTQAQPQTLLMEGDSMPSATQTVDNVPIAEPAQVVPPTDENPVGIIAFHGSGADFDEFKLEKIGTGEGAQAYGYGLYFTDSEDIAKFYRDSVGGANVLKRAEDIKIATPDGGQETAANFSGFRNKFAKYYGDNAALFADRYLGQFTIDPDASEDVLIQRAIDTMNAVKESDKIPDNPKEIISKITLPDRGKIYKVGLEPKVEDLLDYDLPLGEQTPEIKAKLKELIDNELTEDDAMNLGYEGLEINEAKANMLNENRSVVSFLNDWSVFRGYDSAAEELLNKYDIKGIKYRASGSRGAKIDDAAAKRNYVIFDDKLIKIMEKYGIPAGVSVTAVKGAMQDTDDGLLAKDQPQQPQGLL